MLKKINIKEIFYQGCFSLKCHLKEIIQSATSDNLMFLTWHKRYQTKRSQNALKAEHVVRWFVRSTKNFVQARHSGSIVCALSFCLDESVQHTKSTMQQTSRIRMRKRKVSTHKGGSLQHGKMFVRLLKQKPLGRPTNRSTKMQQERLDGRLKKIRK